MCVTNNRSDLASVMLEQWL